MCGGTAILFFLLGLLVHYLSGRSKINSAEKIAKKIIDDANKEAGTQKKAALLEAKEELQRSELKFEKDMEGKRRSLQQSMDNLKQREVNLNRKVDVLDKKEQNVSMRERKVQLREKSIVSKEERLSEIINQQNERLEKIAGMTASEAKEQLIANLEEEARKEAAQMVRDIKEQAQAEAQKDAKQVIVSAIQRCAVEHTVESTVSVVPLQGDEMKGRIIGREGRNIRAFEQATGVEIVVDDTPGAVIISGFNTIRREVAKIALEKLILDGRIHPGKIEETVEKAQQDMEEIIRETGEQASYDVGVHGLHPQIIKLLGRLQYRSSYGQNVLQHSKEVAILSGLIASELGFDVNLAKRAGLLHDVGKAVDQEREGTHTEIGVELAKKYKEHPIVIDAIASHHEDVEPTSLLSVMVQAADAISCSRPGARRETLENYVKRLDRLEELADSFDGVEKAYAIQAGREIRVMVEPEKVDDDNATQMANDIAEKIQADMDYPGQIKVTVIREVRAINYAR
jgi:ribonuclease Y